MSDIIKVRQLIKDGYAISTIKVDNTGLAVIKFIFSGTGNPTEGKSFLLKTRDQAVIQKVPDIIEKRI